MSDPGYGDPCVKTVQEQKRAVGCVLCRPRKRNTRARTRENMSNVLLSELLYNNVNKELHLQELYSSARASRNSQKCFE